MKPLLIETTVFKIFLSSNLLKIKYILKVIIIFFKPKQTHHQQCFKKIDIFMSDPQTYPTVEVTAEALAQALLPFQHYLIKAILITCTVIIFFLTNKAQIHKGH